MLRVTSLRRLAGGLLLFDRIFGNCIGRDLNAGYTRVLRMWTTLTLIWKRLVIYLNLFHNI